MLYGTPKAGMAPEATALLELAGCDPLCLPKAADISAGALAQLCLILSKDPKCYKLMVCKFKDYHNGTQNGTWFQTQLILTTCQIRYHSQCGIIAALDSSEP